MIRGEHGGSLVAQPIATKSAHGLGSAGQTVSSDTPEGVTVTSGPPPIEPPARPVTAVIAANEETALALADKTPRQRPAGLVGRAERSQLGGRTRSALAGLAPRARPASGRIPRP